MKFLSIAHSDVGIKKETNQDSVLIKEASADCGRVLLAVICDGMGGLAKGEVASAALIRAFSGWFDKELPFFLYENGNCIQPDFSSIQTSWNNLIAEVNRRISNYSMGFHAPCGTTVVGLLLVGDHYYIVNVGDSRIYRMDRALHLLTKDQTFVQQEMDAGRMTSEEAKVHPQRNMLLQCVGASPFVAPAFSEGVYKIGDLFFLCSDGFRHVITEEEFTKLLVPEKMQDEKALRDMAVYCTELNKQRRETDNISVVMVKAIA